MEIWKKDLPPQLDDVVVNGQMICLFLNDGRTVSVPVKSFPELHGAQVEPMLNCRVSDDGTGVVWPELGFSVSALKYLP